MNLHEWYGSRIILPDTFGPKITNFVASSIGIIKKLMVTELSDLRITIMECDSPYVHDHTIVFPMSMFRSFDRMNENATVDATISACLGLTVHEAGHIRYSLPTMGAILEAAGFEGKNPLAVAFANTLEDLYLENTIINEEYWTKWMIHAAWDYFLVESMSGELPTVAERPKTLEEASALMMVMIQSKNRNREVLGNCGAYADYAVNKCYEVFEYHDQTERYKFIKQAYFDIFGEEINSMVEEHNAEMQKLLEALLKALAHLMLDSIDKHAEDPVTGFFTDPKREFEEIVDAVVEGTIDRIEGTEQQVITMTPSGPCKDVLKPDKRYYELSQLALQMASKAKPKGQRSNTGHRIVEPQRIILDSKIFRRTVQSIAKRPIEALILVDCSGSMTSGTRLADSFGAAYGAAYGLRQGRHGCAIYGHTGDLYRYGDENTVILRFKTFSDPLEVARPRINYFLQSGSKSQNRDGVAIRQVAKNFTPQPNRKVLIVISDGAPEAGSYSGGPAIVDTTKAVAAVRAMGISVLSISIEANVRKVNDKIYGTDWNVCNDDPSAIADIIKSLL